MRQVHTYSGAKLAAALGIDRDTALRIIRLVRDQDRGEVFSYPRAKRRYIECYHDPGLHDLILHVIDSLLGTCGIEGWTLPDSFTEGVSYCNPGDQYVYTVVLGPDDRFYLASWEGAYERWPSGD